MIRKPMVTRTGIYGFFEEYRFLSNFHLSPVCIDGKTYTSSEAAYQAQKSNSDIVRDSFTLITPSESKKIGRHIELRKDWESIKVLTMCRVLGAKFKQNDALGAGLKATGAMYLEETNDWNDMFWGRTQNGGLNMLGQCLMHIRDMI
jgi:ribA/ribD-fused uncharacterized protein